MATAQASRSAYDVFLSFRGDDTRYGFTKYLYDALTQNNINAFMDGENLGKGEEIDDALVNAIEGSKIAIIVFSERYAFSTWCLDELLKILNCKKRKGQLVIPVFYKVEPTTIRKQRGSYGEAMANHEKRFEDDIEKVQLWRSALFKAASISGWDTPNKFEGDLIKDIVKDVSAKLKTLSTKGSHKSQVCAAEGEAYHNWSDMATETSEMMYSGNIGNAKARKDYGKVGNYGKKPMSAVENGVYNYGNRIHVTSSGAVSKVGNRIAEATEEEDNRVRSFGGSGKYLQLNKGLRYILHAISENGTFGMRHIIELKNDFKVVAVKRFKAMQTSNNYFRNVVEPIGAMDHENLLKLRAYYCSKEERLLFYDFKPNRSLHLHLHDNNGRSKRIMCWEMRLEIALGTARGIKYIHQRHNLPCGNIKSSNIILTDIYEARLSEYCLTPLDDPSSPIKDDGYRAPEVTGPHQVTLESDVYSLGVLLMELVTEKNPTSFKNHQGGLPRWVKYMADSNSIDQIIPTQFNSQDAMEMGQLLRVAIACTVPHPGGRPPMRAVKEAIELLNESSTKAYPTSMNYSIENDAVFQYKRVTHDVEGYPTVNEWKDVKYQKDLNVISISKVIKGFAGNLLNMNLEEACEW